MELLLMEASSAISSPSTWIQSENSLKKKTSCLISANGFSSPRPFSSQKLSVEAKHRKLVIVGAKKKKKKDKEDNHSFVVKPDETGFFPEAVLLKEKKVQEDGRVAPEFADAEEEKLYEFLNLQLESDLKLKEMRHYEVVYLIHEDCVDDVGKVNSKVEDFIREKKGRVYRFSDWGLRRLAYKIKKANNAHYILMNFELEAQSINDFKSMLDKDERVIRHLVIKRDEAITEPCPPPVEFHTLKGDSIDDMDLEDAYDDGDDGEDDDSTFGVADDEDNVIVVEDEDEDDERKENDKAPVSKRGTKIYA